MITIILGVCLVGLAYMTKKQAKDDSHSASDIVVGLILLQVGQLVGALAFVTEEKFLGDNDDLDPMLIVGYEGVAGLVAWSILLPIFQFVPCSFDSVCTNNVIEDTAGVFIDYHANPMLALYSVLMCLLVTVLNISGVSITKYGSSAQRTTCDMLRNLFVWVFFIFVPVRYNKETGGTDTIESFTWL